MDSVFVSQSSRIRFLLFSAKIFKMAVELRRGQQKRKKDSNNNKELVKKKSKKSTVSKELTLKEIDRLNDEIYHLEEEIFQKESSCTQSYSFETLQRIGTELLDDTQSPDLPGSSQGHERSELEKDIDVLNSRISSLESFTGFRFVENNTSVLSKTDSTTVLLREMSGTCQRIPFAVEFEIKEDENMDSTFGHEHEDVEHLEDNSAVVTRLKVRVMDPLAEQELSSFVKTVEGEKALQPFFCGLIQYAEWHSHRQRTFDHFTTKYPETVHLIGLTTRSQSIQLHNRSKPGLVFTVHWRLAISDSGHVVPDLQIYASAPLKETVQKDRSALIRSVPQQFQKVLPILGIEQAIELVIGILCR